MLRRLIAPIFFQPDNVGTWQYLLPLLSTNINLNIYLLIPLQQRIFFLNIWISILKTAIFIFNLFKFNGYDADFRIYWK